MSDERETIQRNPESVAAWKRECAFLREQVEKLTMERDTEIARNRPLQSLIKSTEETKSFLLKKSEENEAIIAAANALENIASTSSSTRIRRVANDALTAIRARRK